MRSGIDGDPPHGWFTGAVVVVVDVVVVDVVVVVGGGRRRNDADVVTFGLVVDELAGVVDVVPLPATSPRVAAGPTGRP